MTKQSRTRFPRVSYHPLPMRRNERGLSLSTVSWAYKFQKPDVLIRDKQGIFPKGAGADTRQCQFIDGNSGG